jgi:hypothetical protein
MNPWCGGRRLVLTFGHGAVNQINQSTQHARGKATPIDTLVSKRTPYEIMDHGE